MFAAHTGRRPVRVEAGAWRHEKRRLQFTCWWTCGRVARRLPAHLDLIQGPGVEFGRRWRIKKPGFRIRKPGGSIDRAIRVIACELQ